tara:strand:- start:308 stop:490 length:183 start_codon:yes stop_codon:yes gene_type:complete
MVEIWRYLSVNQNESGICGNYGFLGKDGIFGIYGLCGKCGQNPKYHAGMYGVSCLYYAGM